MALEVALTCQAAIYGTLKQFGWVRRNPGRKYKVVKSFHVFHIILHYVISFTTFSLPRGFALAHDGSLPIMRIITVDNTTFQKIVRRLGGAEESTEGIYNMQRYQVAT